MSVQSDFKITDVHLSLELLRDLIEGPARNVSFSDNALTSISKCRNYLDDRLANNDSPIYGINTGFGFLCNTQIANADLEQLQENLIRSHACGTGEVAPREVIRLMLILKAKSISFGHSGVAPATVQRLLDLFNNRINPIVFTQGSLGASGDLCPLAHLCLPLIGAGEVMFQDERISGAEMLRRMNWDPIKLRSKEGIGLLNGTQFMLSYAVHSTIKAQRYADWADHLAALSLDAFDGLAAPFSAPLHRIRPHSGQIQSAANVRHLLADSEITHRKKATVQDPYSFRCVPQVHGASRHALDHCADVFVTEVNSTTDNPNIFVEEDAILSGGNFHGQPLAMALEYMTLALAELGSISERRVFQLLSGTRGLPLFLIANPGLNSGLMIAQYTAAALVSQNKQLCTPAVVDTIPSSNGQEDHVSMGANGAVKAYQVLNNLRNILAIELITASQALWFRSPLKTGSALQTMVEAFREIVPPVEHDRVLSTDIAKAAAFIDEWQLTPFPAS